MTASAGIRERVASYQARVNAALDRWLPPAGEVPRRLHEAMRYAALGEGKRMRPLLVYLTGETLGIAPERLDGAACATELIHTYSLVHDDLPAMDDDDLRRGRPTCHRAYDEATAILVGDALQVLAFHILAVDDSMAVDAAVRLRMIHTLTRASGTAGMAGGQALDLAAAGTHMTREEIEHMHTRKTGALIRASVDIAAACVPDLANDARTALAVYADSVGLAFQIQDDILDVEGDEATIGKTPGADEARGKPTFPSVCGLAESKRIAASLHARAVGALERFGDRAEPLRWLAGYLAARQS